jgi:lysophospholipase
MVGRPGQADPMTETAPLISIAHAPIPEGGAAEWVESFDHLRLRAALFPAKGPVRGSVVLSPGRTEPIEKYFEVIGELQGRGFVVLCHDWRGQGLSGRLLKERLRGHAQGMQPFFDDYQRLLNHFEARLPKPWIAMGHSMGGALTLAILAGGERRFSGAALSAPMLGLVTDGWGYPFARALTWGCSHLGLAGRYLFGDPADPFAITFEKDRLGHERSRWDRYRAQVTACPDLALGNLTWGWLEFALSMAGRLRRPGAVEKIDIPVVIVAAGADDRVLTSASAATAKRLRYGRYVEIEGAYHEILMETDDIRAIFWREFDTLADDVAPLRAKAAARP